MELWLKPDEFLPRSNLKLVFAKSLSLIRPGVDTVEKMQGTQGVRGWSIQPRTSNTPLNEAKVVIIPSGVALVR